MKTRIINKIVPESTIPESVEEIIEYCCDKCEFSSTYQEETEKHYSTTHACIATKSIWDNKYFYFKTEDDLNKFAESYTDEYVDGWNHKWAGEGWYVSSTKTRPCSRGCCTETYMFFEPVNDEFICKLEESIKESEAELKDIRELLKEKY